MNEGIIGILIPMLMSGAGIGDIFRALIGSSTDSSKLDGLSAMMGTQRYNARYGNPLVQDGKRISGASDMLLDRLGVNPYSGVGQGLSSMVGAMYRVAPDTVGGILGIPNGRRFFETVANGAPGINMASGSGMPDIFNPYSVTEAHNRTMSMARKVYNLGINKNGGYNIDYGHGLNMDEMGMMTQRLLSSNIPYQEYETFQEGPKKGELNFAKETGNRLDPESAKFEENLKKLGSKFNEAASMLSKVTGSVKEAITVMDRLGGGNFLGGTAEQASAVADRAKKMATTLRVTAAVAGIDPREMYKNMQGLQLSMASGMGLDPYFSEASGFNNLLTDMAYTGTEAYGAWSAMNPNASPAQRQQALFAANGRAQAYASNNGATLAAAFADNAHLFSKEEQQKFVESYRSGRPNDMVDMIRKRIGEGMYTEYMTDPAMQIAARQRAAKENPDLLREIDRAGQEGNLAQAEEYGAKRLTDIALSDIGEDMYDITGKSEFSQGIDKSLEKSYRQQAVKAGLSEERVGSMSVYQLRAFLKKRPGVNDAEFDRNENKMRIQAAKDRIDELTMGESDMRESRDRLKSEISQNTDWNEAQRKEMIARIDRGEDLKTVYDEYAGGVKGESSVGMRERVFGGKMTKTEADRAKEKLARIESPYKKDFTLQERMTAIDNAVKRGDLENAGNLKKIMYEDGVKNAATDAEAMSAFALKASGSKDMPEIYGSAIQKMISSNFKGELGNLKGEDLKNLESSMSEKALSLLKSGDAKSLPEAIAKVFDESQLTEEQRNAIGDKGMEKLDQDKQRLKDPNSELAQKTFSRTALLSTASSVMDGNRKDDRNKKLDEMRKIAAGDYGKMSKEEAEKKFNELAKSLNVNAPEGQRDNTFAATVAAGDKNQALMVMAASMAKMSGMDFSKLNLGPGSEGFVSALDDATSNANLNRIPNALKIGGASFYSDAIKTTEARIAKIRESISGKDGVSRETTEGAFGTGPEAEKKRNELAGKLREKGSIDVESDLALIKATINGKIGGKNGIDALYDTNVMAEGRKQKGSDADIIDITKAAGREEDSGAYSIMKEISDLTKKIAPFFDSPDRIFNVKITDSQIPLDTL